MNIGPVQQSSLWRYKFIKGYKLAETNADVRRWMRQQAHAVAMDTAWTGRADVVLATYRVELHRLDQVGASK